MFPMIMIRVFVVWMLAWLALAAASWLASFSRREGPLPFGELLSASMFSLVMVFIVGLVFHVLTGYARLSTACLCGMGWMTTLLSFHRTLEITWADALLAASAGWLAVLALGFMFLTPGIR
jgi:hypothetical protein